MLKTQLLKALQELVRAASHAEFAAQAAGDAAVFTMARQQNLEARLMLQMFDPEGAPLPDDLPANTPPVAVLPADRVAALLTIQANQLNTVLTLRNRLGLGEISPQSYKAARERLREQFKKELENVGA